MTGKAPSKSLFLFFLCFLTTVYGQKISNNNGVRIVENEKEGKWKNKPELQINYLGKFGNQDENDFKSTIKVPEDIIADQQGNIYVVDGGGEYKISKFDKNKKFLLSFGRKGRGPGEMIMPTNMSITPGGKIFVFDDALQRINIFSTEGKSLGSINVKWNLFNFAMLNDELMAVTNRKLDGGGGAKPLFYIMNTKGKIEREIGEGPYPSGKPTDQKEAGGGWNRLNFAVDNNMHLYAAFKFSNLISKYDKDGKLLMQIRTKGLSKYGGNNGIAVDSKERIWMLTQIKSNPKPSRRMPSSGLVNESELENSNNVIMMVSPTEGKTIKRPKGVQLNTKCDLFALELYDKEGTLLYKYLLNHRINRSDRLRIYNDKIYILEEMIEGTFHVYKIGDL